MRKVIISVILAIVLITPILFVNVCAEDIAIKVSVLVEPVLDYDVVIDGFGNGLLRVVKDGKNGFIDRTGKLIIPCEYNALSFSEGLAVVHETNEDDSEKWGFIDTSGKIVIPLKYNWVSSFNNGRAVFEENKKYGLLDKKGNIAVPAVYDAMWCKYDGTWDVQKDGKWGIIDKNGDFVLPLEFEGTYSFSERMAVTQKDNKYGFINEKGEWVIPAIYNNAASFHEGLARVLENDEGNLIEKFIDKTGKVVLDLDDYDYKSAANYFSEGLCLVHKDKKFGFIDKTGKIVIPMVYDILDDNPYSFDAPDSFHDGRAIVKKDGKYGIIDTKGKEVAPITYDYIRYFLTNFNNDSIYNGYVAAEKDGKWGILNYRTGIEIVPPAYDFIDYNAFGEDGLVVVKKDSKCGILQIVEAKPNKFDYVLTATPAKSTVLIDGKETVFDTYEIDGETYFKLRDVAYTLSGTTNQFEVTWDSSKNAINLTSGKAYTQVGGEMTDRGTEKKTPVLSKSKIYLNSREVAFTAYTIEGNNYFTLTSIANAVGFVAERNGNPAGAGNTFIINTAPFNETLERYYDYVRNNNQVIMLMHDDYQEGFLDREMAAYAYLAMPNKDSVNGNTKEEFDAITEKYFGKKIDDYNTGMTYVIPETGRIAPTGWDYSRIYMVLKELSEDTNGIGTGIFYTIYIHPGDEFPEKNDLLSGKFETYLYREYGGIYLVEMQFKEKYDENGEMYFEYLSINYTGETVGSDEKITPYGSEQELEKSIPDPIQHEQLETFRFPTSEKHTAVEELTEKELIKYSNQYFYKNDAAVSLLANKIHSFISYDNSLLEDFEGINNINCNLAQYAAYRLSPRIYVTTDYGEYIDYLEKYPDHIISKLIYEKKSRNINIDDLRYIDDIKENLIYLFGDENKQLLNIENDIVIDGLKYKCAINAGVVYLEGTVTYNSGTPQITSYKKTESGYIYEAIILPAYDIIYYEGKSIKVDNQSAVMAYAHLLPKYRFEFKEADDGRLILYSQKTLYLP